MSPSLSLDLQRLLAEEPFVRALARALSQDHADDVAQDTWVRALREVRSPVQAPRRWLARIAARVASNARRAAARRQAHEAAAATPELVPSSLELMEREERRRALVLAVDGLPAPLRTVVLLRWFDGQPPRVIAERLGVPVATVWDRLHRALSVLRSQLDAEHGGDRKAWLLPLTVRWEAPAVGASVWMGVLLMTTKVKTLAVAVVMLMAGAALWAVSGGLWVMLDPATEGGAPGGGIPAETSGTTARPEGSPAAAREPVASAPAASTAATLVVHATYAEDGTPAAGATLVAYRRGEDLWIGKRRQKTDAKGVARFEGVEPGTVRVRTDFGRAFASAEVQAGQTTEVELKWPAGIDLTGIVVDPGGEPIAAAEVWYAPLAAADQEAAHVATTGEDGRFTLRSAGAYCHLGARASGRAPSPMQFVLQERGQRKVRIVLPGAGGDVEGTVARSDGRPVADAVVRIGDGRLLSIFGSTDGSEALPALVRTDGRGRFHAVGLAAGEHPVVARAAGLQPWTGVCRVVEGVAASLQVTLEPGVTVAGTVKREDGSAVAGARIAAGEAGALDSYRAVSRTDGTFRLEGLPCSELVVAGTHQDHGRGTVRLRGAAGETLSCELPLGLGIVLRGRLLLESGEPVAGGTVGAAAEPLGAEERWQDGATTGPDGAFRIAGCPEGRPLHILAEGAGIVALSRHRVDPRAGELVLRARAAPKPSARVVGAFVLPDGKPGIGLMVSVKGVAVQTDASGRIALQVIPGTVQVSLMTEELALFQPSRELAPYETWDLGTVRLSKGGTVHVRLSGETAGARLWLRDRPGSGFASIHPATHRSRLVPAGRYEVVLWGPTTAAAVIPVEVREGEETVVEVKCQVGVTQRFVFTAPGGWPDVGWFSVQITGAGGPVFDGTARIDDEGRSTLECRLLPGAYTLTATAAGRAGRVEFTAVEGDNASVSVELR